MSTEGGDGLQMWGRRDGIKWHLFSFFYHDACVIWYICNSSILFHTVLSDIVITFWHLADDFDCLLKGMVKASHRAAEIKHGINMR